MTDPTPAGGAQSSNRTLMIVLAYLGPLALIPLLVEKNDPEVQWHAKHGLVLFVAEIVLYIGLSIVFWVLGHIRVLACIAAAGGCLLWTVLMLAILVLHVVCIIKGVNGERFKLPVISDYADKF